MHETRPSRCLPLVVSDDRSEGFWCLQEATVIDELNGGDEGAVRGIGVEKRGECPRLKKG